jgi:hypothetical protein
MPTQRVQQNIAGRQTHLQSKESLNFSVKLQHQRIYLENIID